MATNDVTHVSAGKPKIGGSIFTAAVGSTLPASVFTALDAAFENVGYISDAGVVNSNTRTMQTVRAWGGDPVLDTQTEKTDTFQFTMLETGAKTPKEIAFGEDNVTESAVSGSGSEIITKVNALELGERSYVIETLLRSGLAHRLVIPRGKVTALGDITYVDGAAVGYQVTLTAYPDSEGNTHYEYTQTA